MSEDIEGYFFTRTELIDLLAKNKIINNDNILSISEAMVDHQIKIKIDGSWERALPPSINNIKEK